MKTWFDSKLFQFFAGVVDVVWISLLWYISSLPAVTLGASSAAMYYTVHTRIFKNEGYLFPVYKKAFLDNFKKATVVWLFCLLLDLFLVLDLFLARMAIDQGSALAVLYYPVLICIVIDVMCQLSIVAYQARFEDIIKGVLVKGSVIAVSNIGWLLFLTAFLFGLIYLCRYLIFLAVVAPAGYTCLMHHVFEHIYKKRGWLIERS